MHFWQNFLAKNLADLCSSPKNIVKNDLFYMNFIKDYIEGFLQEGDQTFPQVNSPPGELFNHQCGYKTDCFLAFLYVNALSGYKHVPGK